MIGHAIGVPRRPYCPACTRRVDGGNLPVLCLGCSCLRWLTSAEQPASVAQFQSSNPGATLVAHTPTCSSCQELPMNNDPRFREPEPIIFTSEQVWGVIVPLVLVLALLLASGFVTGCQHAKTSCKVIKAASDACTILQYKDPNTGETVEEALTAEDIQELTSRKAAARKPK